MKQELLQEIASYWGTRAEGYSEVNEKELAGSQREAWLHVLEEQFPEKKKEEMKILDIGTGPGFFPMILSEAGYTVAIIVMTFSEFSFRRESSDTMRIPNYLFAGFVKAEYL